VPEHTETPCDVCGADADLMGHYPGLRPRQPRWCGTCAGPALTQLVRDGQVVTVTTAQSSAAAPADDELADGFLGQDWTVDQAVQMLRHALPSGSRFLRALINEGGVATAARLRKILDEDSLGPMTQTLNGAMRKTFRRSGQLGGERHLARPGRNPDNPRDPTVYDYALPQRLVPILDKALRELKR